MRVQWRGLELPSQVVCDRSTLTDRYGKFIAEPFERGFGVTIGNSLRRILLSSLEGSAVTKVKIQGALHEITSLPGVVEDVTDIILNVKALVVRNHSSQPRTLRINRCTKGVVTAADIEPDDQVTIINKDRVIATLTDDVPFVMEMVVENGRGYVPASEHTPQISEIGVIPVDAMFSPVVKVRYEVEETRVGQKTNYDKLTMEIWTDGSITPEMALVEAAKILRKHLNPFVQYTELGPKVFADSRSVLSQDSTLDSKLSVSLADLKFSTRTLTSLESAGIHTVRDLVAMTEQQLLDLRNFGETSLAEVKDRLATLGLRLGMRTSPSPGGVL
ncbi:MAG TPA: DNA-directed RNA polymerase subunit alpha [Thermogutta sp.]|nr:DNA-directed RNA polymerase subunit alpha [Thermogutta sp.]HPU06619.1 DNA-directed RNA polymerase subunit alpha [Thermogutta sp.]